MEVRVPPTFEQTSAGVHTVQPEEFRVKSNEINGSPYDVTQQELSQSAIDSSQSTIMSPLNPCNMFFTGYLDCAHEALRYLLEVEQLPHDHPMVLGLQYQLYQHYRLLYVQHLFAGSVNVSGEATVHPLLQQQCTHDDTCLSNNSLSSGSSEFIKTGSEEHDVTCEADDMYINETNATTGKQIFTPHDTKPSHSQMKEIPSEQELDKQYPKEHTSLTTDVILQNSGLSEDAQRVAMTLAEEIFTLMNADDDESDDDYDDDNESIDEGFEEMKEI